MFSRGASRVDAFSPWVCSVSKGLLRPARRCGSSFSVRVRLRLKGSTRVVVGTGTGRRYELNTRAGSHTHNLGHHPRSLVTYRDSTHFSSDISRPQTRTRMVRRA